MPTATLAKRELVQPDFWTCPHGVRVRPELTYGPAVAEICDKAGYTPDPQQELGLDLVFAIRPDGSPLAFSGCVICARQNLKSGLFQQCVIGWLFVTEVPEIAWSAHELRTSLNAQTELYRTLESPALSKYLPASGRPNPGLYDTNGKERIELNTGQTVWFQTRTRDGGRGLGKPKVIIDEAFKFKKRTAGALLPIMLAQHHPQLLYGSSEPPDDPDAEHIRDVIDRGQNHKSPSMWFLQWRAPREDCKDPDCTHPKDALARGLDCALDREHLLRAANPTLTTGRITLETLRNLRQELDPAEFMRECLGWADLPGASAGPPALDLRRWSTPIAQHGLKAPEGTPPQTKAAVVIDVEPDGSAATIGVAGDGPTGRTLVTVDMRPGTSHVAAAVQKLQERLEVLEVSLHPGSQAGPLGVQLTALDIEWTKLTSTDLGHGCSSFITGVNREARFVHVDQPELNAAVAAARTRKVSQAILWDRDNPVPLGPVVAGSTAAHRYALLTAKPEMPPPSPVLARARKSSQKRDDFNPMTVGF